MVHPYVHYLVTMACANAVRGFIKEVIKESPQGRDCGGSSIGRAPDSGSGGCGFKSHPSPHKGTGRTSIVHPQFIIPKEFERVYITVNNQ